MAVQTEFDEALRSIFHPACDAPKRDRKGKANPVLVTESDSSLVTVKEAQVLLRRGRARVYEMINKNELKHIRDGRSILIPKKCIEDWIELKRRQNGR